LLTICCVSMVISSASALGRRPLTRAGSVAFAAVPLRPAPAPLLPSALRGGSPRLSNVPGEAVSRIGGVWGAATGRLASLLNLRMTKKDDREVESYGHRFEDLSTSRDGVIKDIAKLARESKHTNKGKKVAIVGSGNFASALVPIVGKNCARLDEFQDQVNMWVFEEQVEGRNLSEIINEEHENVKYLPGIKFPENVVAVPDVKKACEGANLLIFCIPHQFLGGICAQVKEVAAPGCIAVSLIKGVEFDDNGIVLISQMLSKQLGGMDVSVLMGANLAWEIAKGSFCETTVGYKKAENGATIQRLFDDPLFRVGVVQDVPGVEACGALKNVVALGAGFCDGLDLGDNSKGAIIRIGLMEMKRFIQSHFPGVKDETFFQSCGVADLIVTCYGGRNRRCAEAFVRAKGEKTFEDLEQELLNGQKLQGTPCAEEIFRILEAEGDLDDYPLFQSIYRIAFCGAPPESMIAAVACYGSTSDICEIPEELPTADSIVGSEI